MSTKYPSRFFVPMASTLGATFLAMHVAYAVDGVTLISQSKALAGDVTPGDAPGFPVTLTRRGSYRLSTNLRVVGDTDGIEVFVEDVAIDLNGFSIRGPGGTGSGNGINAPIARLSTTNGIVLNFGGTGVICSSEARITRLQIMGNRGGGIRTSASFGGSIVRDNILTFNGGEAAIWLTGSGDQAIGNTLWNNTGIGIRGGGACIVKENAVSSSGGHGIRAFNGCLVSDNSVRDSGGFELFLDPGVGYKGNVLTTSPGGNTGSDVSGGIEIGTNVCGNDTICP